MQRVYRRTVCVSFWPRPPTWCIGRSTGSLRGNFNTIDNKNGMLFEPVEGKTWLMLHRPMEGEGAMNVHWAESDHLFGEWKSKGVLIPWIANPRFKDVWTGGGAPPMLLSDGRYLILYHIGNREAKGKREYDLGIALCDPRSATPIVLRAEPLLCPSTPQETTGDADLGVNNVVFICGAYFLGRRSLLPVSGGGHVHPWCADPAGRIGQVPECPAVVHAKRTLFHTGQTTS